MKKTFLTIAALSVSAAALSVPAFAQVPQPQPPAPPTSQVPGQPPAGAPAGAPRVDFKAMADARLAAAQAALKLNPEQTKGWPAVQSAIRELYQVRERQFKAMMDNRGGDQLAILTMRADSQAQTGLALRSFVAAATPIYATLDAEGRRNLLDLAQMGGPGQGPGMRVPGPQGQGPQAVRPPGVSGQPGMQPAPGAPPAPVQAVPPAPAGKM